MYLTYVNFSTLLYIVLLSMNAYKFSIIVVCTYYFVPSKESVKHIFLKIKNKIKTKTKMYANIINVLETLLKVFVFIVAAFCYSTSLF